LLNIEIDNTPCIVVVCRYYRTKSRRALKGNECAAYFENDEKQQRAAELSLANTELAFQNEQKKSVQQS
jgi:hypothetical protein